MPLEPEAAYHNQHAESKDFTHVRVRSGYVPQAQEINELQSIQDTQRKNLGNLLFTSGTVQRGGTCAKNGSTLSLGETQIWFEGRVLTAPAATHQINNADDETAGILITETLVTGDDDPALLEPDADALNHGMEGANRTRVRAAWVVNNPLAVIIYKFKDGVQQFTVPSSRIDPVNEAMARRTYAESGNYVVSGFEVSAVESGETTFSYAVGNSQDSVRNGSLAYVKGNEIAKLVPDYITNVPKALTTLAAQDTYTLQPVTPGAPTDAELKFNFAYQPPKVDTTTTTIRAVFDVFLTVNGHTTNGTDALTLSPGHSLVDILRVYKDADINNVSDPTTAYLKAATQGGPGAWYRNGNTIKWDVTTNAINAWSGATPYAAAAVVSHAGNHWQAKQASTGQTPADPSVYWQQVSISEPGSGEPYYAYALVSRDLSPSEYTIDYVNGSWQLSLTPLVTRPYSLNKIDDSAASSTILVDYQHYLPRIDIVYVDGNGVVAAQPGAPALNPIAPSIPGDVLALAQVSVAGGFGGAASAAVKPFVNKRLTMLELQDMARRVRQLELNVALKDLDTQGLARASNSMATLRSILTEGFAYTADDVQKNTESNPRLKFSPLLTTDNCIDVANRTMTLPLIEATPVALTPVGVTAGGPLAITLDSTGFFYPEAYLDQQKRTNTLRVNQFDVYIEPPVLQIDPKFGERENNVTTIKTYDPTSAAVVAQLYKANWKAYTEGLADPQKSFVQSRIYDYMKRNWVWVYGSGYPANTLIEIRVDGRAPMLRATHPDSAKLFNFNGSVVPSSPIVQASGAAATTTTLPPIDGIVYTAVYPESSVVRSTNLGEFGCAVLIPEGLPTGAVSISAVPLDAAQNGAEAVYTVQGILQIENNGAAAMYQLTELVDSTFKQVPPKILDMIVKVNGTELPKVNGIYNFTTSSNLTVEVHFDKGSAARASLPREVILLVKGAGKSGSLTLASGQAGFNPDTGIATFSGGILNTCAVGLELVAFASNVRSSSEALLKTVTYQGNVPTGFEVSMTALTPTNNAGNNVFTFGFTAGTNVNAVTAHYTVNGTTVTLNPVATT